MASDDISESAFDLNEVADRGRKQQRGAEEDLHNERDGTIGKGFDLKIKKNTLGLIGLRERAVSINGKLSVESQPGKGTTVLAVIPKR